MFYYCITNLFISVQFLRFELTRPYCLMSILFLYFLFPQIFLKYVMNENDFSVIKK